MIKIERKGGDNVIVVTVATALIATIAHLDGTTATTVLITIPALYPVYKKMNIDTRILLCLTGACMGVMNLLPWGGPVAPATYLGIGLAGVEIKDHIKYCFGWQWGVSLICLVAGLILGVITF